MSARPRTTAIIYARISQDREGGGLGVQRQEADCRALAERQGWTVVNVITDNDISAYSGKTRPGYRQLLGDLRNGRVDVVLAWHTDRLHRSPIELEEYINACETHGVTTHTVRAGPLDLATANGKMQARIAGAVARQESEHRGERVAAARAQRARSGGWGGGVRPFGFEDDGVTVRPVEAAEIVNATTSVLAGNGLRAVVRDLNERGITTSRGRMWTSMTLRDVLRRPRNAGLSEHRGEIVGQLPGKPIVDEERWRAVTALLNDPARRTSPGGQVRWLGSGLYLCGVCRKPWLRVSSSGHRLPSYRCASRATLPRQTGHVTRNAESLDTFVRDVVVARLSAPGAIDLLRDAPVEVDTGALHMEAAVLQQRMSDLSTAFADGGITLPQLRDGSERLRLSLAEVDKQLDEAAQLDPLVGLVDVPDVAQVWRSAGLSLQRAVVDSLMTVTVLPAGAKRAADGARFNPESIDVQWKR